MVIKIKFILTMLLFIAFFLPWFSANIMFSKLTISGFQFVGLLTSELGHWVKALPSIFYLIYILPLLAIISLIKIKSRGWSFLAGTYGLLICLFAFSLVDNESSTFVNIISFGGYITLLSSIGLVITSFMNIEPKMSSNS
ncbi:hypothetical protein ACLIA0_12855 [Bacillaceae bacterium W0354]